MNTLTTHFLFLFLRRSPAQATFLLSRRSLAQATFLLRQRSAAKANFLFLFFFPFLTNAQHDDQVLSTMYRYVPSEVLAAQNIDSCVIYLKGDSDSLIHDQTIVYDSLGKESMLLDFGSRLEYRFRYDKYGNLITSKLIDWDHGEGPADSFIYNSENLPIMYFNLFMGEIHGTTEYRYKNGLISEKISKHSKLKYRYKDSLRTGYVRWTSHGLEEYFYIYDDEQRLWKVAYQPPRSRKKYLRFILTYNKSGLLQEMQSFSYGKLDQRYTYTYDELGLLLNRLQETGINSGSLQRSEFFYRYHSKKEK